MIQHNKQKWAYDTDEDERMARAKKQRTENGMGPISHGAKNRSKKKRMGSLKKARIS